MKQVDDKFEQPNLDRQQTVVRGSVNGCKRNHMNEVIEQYLC
jgi:hypothetical protein